MRLYLLSATALLALAAPAMAQDRTLPAGTSFDAQPPIDRALRQAEMVSPAYEGRSVEVAPAPRKAAHHFHRH